MAQSLQYQLPSGGLMFKHSAWKEAGQLSQQIRDPPITWKQMKIQNLLFYRKLYSSRSLFWIERLSLVDIWKDYNWKFKSFFNYKQFLCQGIQNCLSWTFLKKRFTSIYRGCTRCSKSLSLPRLHTKHQLTLMWVWYFWVRLGWKCLLQTMLCPGRFSLPAAIQKSPVW